MHIHIYFVLIINLLYNIDMLLIIFNFMSLLQILFNKQVVFLYHILFELVYYFQNQNYYIYKIIINLGILTNLLTNYPNHSNNKIAYKIHLDIFLQYFQINYIHHIFILISILIIYLFLYIKYILMKFLNIDIILLMLNLYNNIFII